MARLGQDFYDQSTIVLAEALLGKLLVRKLQCGATLSGIVVEVEAYLASDDPASHSFPGRSRRNASMFADPGTLYVYAIHSRHCLNVVSEPNGQGAAVLIRAVEPMDGLKEMAENRHQATMERGSRAQLRDLTSGPGRLCEALAVDKRLDGLSLCGSESIWLEPEPRGISIAGSNIRTGSRIGISKARDLPLRWFIDGNYFVSGLARDHTAGRKQCLKQHPD